MANPYSWQAALAEAKARAAFIAEAAPKGSRLSFAIYPSVEDYRRSGAADEAKWPWRFHCAVMRALKRLLTRQGYEVQLKELHAREYLFWLAINQLPNSQSSRARYINEYGEKET